MARMPTTGVDRMKRLVGQLLMAGMLILLAVSPTAERFHTLNVPNEQLADATDMFPPAHNVTLTVQGHEILFIGQDLDHQIKEYLPVVLGNESVTRIIEKYAEILLFIDTAVRSGYISLVGMNSTYFVQIMLIYSYNHGEFGNLQEIEVLSGGNYLDSLKTALTVAMQENETRNLNVTAWDKCAPGPGCWPPLRPYIWSYNYTDNSFLIGDQPSSVIWEHENESELLHHSHWELGTLINTSVLVMPSSDPESWYSTYMELDAVLSVTMDGELIKVLVELIPLAETNVLDVIPYVIVGSAFMVCMVVLVIFKKRH